MNISHNKYDAIENLIYSEDLRIESVKLSPQLDVLYIQLNNHLVFVAPISSYKRLKNASPEHLKHFKLIANQTGIHWPEIDEDLSLKGFLKEYLLHALRTENKLVLA